MGGSCPEVSRNRLDTMIVITTLALYVVVTLLRRRVKKWANTLPEIHHPID